MKVFLTGFTLLIILFSPIFADQPSEDFFVPARISANAALMQLRTETPEAQVYKLSQRVTRIYGHTFGYGASPEATAEQFRLNHTAVLGAEAADLQPVSLLQDGRHTQQLMYNPVTGEHKFTLVYYTQYRDDIPVFRSDLRLLVRNEPDYPLVLASSALRYLGEFSVADKNNVNFDLGKSAALAEFPSLTDFSKSRTVIWAGYNDNDAEPRLALEFTGNNDTPEHWLFVADAITGEILYKENLIIFEDVYGHVKGYATEGTAAEHCEAEVIMALPYARVNIGATFDYTDNKGYYVVSNPGMDSVIIESQIMGEFFQTYNYAGSDSYLADTVLPPGPVEFLHNSLNIEYKRAEVNGYIYANIIRDLVLVYVPTYPAVSTQTNFPIYVNRNDGYCPGNAWYSSGDQSINFCRASSPYPNTSWQSVIHHEYGHHLINVAGSGQDQYGEGMSDCVAIMHSDESGLGFGFFGDCNTPLREADNTMQYPCSGGSHDCAPLLSGCIWDLRNELIWLYPATYMDTLRNLTFNSILLHTGSQITPQITIDYLTLDDDDGNLDNGTPHYNEICAAFGNHNMDCPELILIWFEYPEGRPEIVTPNIITIFDVIVHTGTVSPISGSGTLYYSIDGAPYTTGTMTETSPNEYEITLPGVSCGGKIDYYITAEATGFGTIFDPSDAPTTPYQAVSATEMVAVFSDNFETNQGWTVSGSVSDGAWIRGTPIGGGDRGDPPTDFDGSGQCYLTDNVDGNSDVDDGTTILISPTIDLSEGDASIHYARWYSNNWGADPNNDVMNIFVSNDDGSSWTLVETVGPVNEANGGWYENTFAVSDFVTPTATVKVRFDASDLSAGSVVEAAVDDFTVTSYRCGSEPVIVTVSLPDWTASMPYSQQLVATGGVGELTWSDKYSELIGTGLTLSTTGLVSGTPLSAGPVSFTAVVTDEARGSAERQFSFTINTQVVITTDALADWTVGQAYSALLEASGGTPPISWSDRDSDLLGTGLALSSGGTLSGVPSSEGSISFTARAGDTAGDYDDKGLSFTINPAVDITTTSLPDGTDGSAYSEQLEAIGGTGSKTWTDKNGDLSGTGLTLSTSGLLSGTPTDTGTISFTAQAEDMTGSSDEQLLPLTVGPAFICGDANADLLINIFDITHIIAFLYQDGPPPQPMESADVDNSGEINIFDVTTLISYLYIDGAEPVCP